MSNVKTVLEFNKSSGSIIEVCADSALKIKFDVKSELPQLWDKFQTVEGVFTVTSRNLHENYVIASLGNLSPGNLKKRS